MIRRPPRSTLFPYTTLFRSRQLQPSGEAMTLSAADPLNLVGILVPGERVPAVSGKLVTYRDGVPVAAEQSETRVQSMADRKSTRLNSSHGYISYAVFCLKKKKISTCN